MIKLAPSQCKAAGVSPLVWIPKPNGVGRLDRRNGYCHHRKQRQGPNHTAHWTIPGVAAIRELIVSSGAAVLRRFYMWMSLAARATGEQNDDAVSGLELIAKNMTPAQIAEAKRLSGEWKPREATARAPENPAQW